MSRASALVVLRIATLIALAASAALMIDYRSAELSFCSAESGCAALRRSEIAYLWGIGLQLGVRVTLPDLGLVSFAGLYALTLTRFTHIAARLALAGGIIALALLGAQAFVLQRFCWLCVTADLSALVAGVAALKLLRAEPNALSEVGLASWAWGALAAIAVTAPALWPQVRPLPPVPASIRGYYRADKINVIEFADFECPYCRNLHARLKALLVPYGDRIHFARLNMPLESHEHARDAALAALCAEPSGKADALADFLFTTDDLSLPSIQRAAAELGIDASTFKSCLTAPATRERLEREMKAVRDAGLEGLPTTYVGGKRLVGAQSDDMFKAALERATRSEDESGVPGWAYLLVVLASVLTVLRLGYRPTASTSHVTPAANKP